MGIQINGTNDTITTNDGTISIDGSTTLTGSLTGTTGVFSGDVGVAGTLTSEDKTNIDSVGLITARTGIKIGPITGVAATHYADGSIRTTGIITATSYYGSGANLTGITAVGGATGVDFNDGVKARWGTGNDLEIHHTSGNSFIENSTGTFKLRGATVEISNPSAAQMLQCNSGAGVNIYHNGSKKFETVSAGVNIPANNLTIDANNGEKISLKGTANPYIRWYESSTAKAYIQWNSAGYLHIENEEASKSIKIDSSGATVSGDFVFGANAKAKLFENGVQSGVQATNSGSSAHLMTHDGAEDIHVDPSGYIKFEVAGTERVRISSSGRLLLNTTDNSGYSNRSAYFTNPNDPWNYISITGATNGGAGIVFGDGTGQSTANYESYMYHNNSDNHFYLRTNQGNKEFKFTSGGNLELGHGNIKVPSGNGIDFSATSDASGSSSELFDDYEEGSWTPTLAAQSSNPSVTYAERVGRYRKIGDIVHIFCHIDISAGNISGGSGDAQITGLPYTMANNIACFYYSDQWKQIPNTYSAGRSNSMIYAQYNSTYVWIHQYSASNPQVQTGWGINQVANGNRFNWAWGATYRVS